ncbi:MAG TPA: [protein-PII] uridylyltransferase, partial [Usitatibacteraceae bacterium]|nr:[protein-PII] uridylyltransferase [Usitatibacteraceae bacterium]
MSSLRTGSALPRASALDADSPAARNGDIKALRRWLLGEREQLRQAYQRRPNPDRNLTQHATVVDRLIAHVARSSGLPDSHAVVAVGGYGRGFLFPWSDVDLVILRGEEQAADAQAERFVGLLWDIGLEPGIAVRTIAECVEEAGKDVTVDTSLLEARIVHGDPGKVAALLAALSAARDVPRFAQAKIDEQRRRHARHNDVALNLEPNIKESPGGLRDLQTIMWLARAAGIGQDWNELSRLGLISPFEAKLIGRLRHTLIDLRIRLHYLAGRREDRLVFDHQAALAAELGIAPTATKQASEILMQRYYLAAKGVWQMNSILIPALMDRIVPRGREQVKPIDGEFSLVNGNIAANDVTLFEREPLAVLRAFIALQRVREAEFFEPETLRALWRGVHLIDATVRNSAEAHRLFLSILTHDKVSFTLRRMSRYGVLGRLLPAFGRIVGQMQHDLFHVYTVDEHILMVIRNLRRLVLPRFAHEFPFCHELAGEFARPEVLYLAALFHDIAKGRGGDHSTLGKKDARQFCRKLGLARADVDLITWLVEHHLQMSAVAQKQDLADPDVISAFAQFARDERRLTALYLLTVADIRGTSPHVWNNWKARLLEQLFRATRRLLRGDAVHNERWMELKKAEALALYRRHAGEAAVPRLWTHVDENYFQRFDAGELAWHARETDADPAPPHALVRVREATEDSGAESFAVMVMTRDQPGLFARITGFFEKLSCDIATA